MFRNRTNTILLITRDELMRADLHGGSSGGPSVYRAARPAVDDLATLVEAALRLSTARPGQVWVLSTEIWTQTIALAAQTVAGLEPEQLARALGFEAEPLSNIRGVEARAACVPVSATGNEREFWTTILPESQLQQIEFAVERVGGRLAGVAHPGGLPWLLATEVSAAPAMWRRVELWPGAIVCLAAAAVCLALCAGHYLAVESIRRAQVAETARLRQPTEQLVQLKKEGDGLRTKRDKLRAECDRLSADLDNCRRVMLSQRLRVARLLAVLARQDPDQLVLEKITGSGDHVVLYGISLRTESVNALTKILDSELGPLGWQVQVPNEKAREMLMGGGPWQFEVHIQDVVPSAASKPATVKSGRPEVSS
jgi:Tfp pilus assembly protein PilN